jgi:hypothetical protein
MLDSTAIVAAERQGKNARQLLETVVLETGDKGIAVSVRIPLSDLLIGASALDLGYGVGTATSGTLN